MLRPAVTEVPAEQVQRIRYRGHLSRTPAEAVERAMRPTVEEGQVEAEQPERTELVGPQTLAEVVVPVDHRRETAAQE